MATDLRGSGSRSDDAFRWIAIGSAALVLLVLGLIVLTMTGRMGPVLDKMGFGFLTSKTWSPLQWFKRVLNSVATISQPLRRRKRAALKASDWWRAPGMQ